MKPKEPVKRNVAERSSSPEISIWLDGYNDLFSDFDPRGYEARNISDDFLHEVRKLTGENEAKVRMVRLLLDQKLRDEKTESIITRRLHDYFLENFHRLVKKQKSNRYRSILFLGIGILMMLGAGYFSYYKAQNPVMLVPLVVLEPAGWFLTWMALDLIFNSAKKAMPELEFYGKLTKARIAFENI